MKAKNSKYTQLKAALQGKFREVAELRKQYTVGVREVKQRAAAYLIAEAELANSIGKHEAAKAALDKELERLEGVYQSRLQQLRNELAQTTAQLETAQVNAHRAMGRAAIAEQGEERAKKALRTERGWCWLLGATLLADTFYYHVSYAKLAALLGL